MKYFIAGLMFLFGNFTLANSADDWADYSGWILINALSTNNLQPVVSQNKKQNIPLYDVAPDEFAKHSSEFQQSGCKALRLLSPINLVIGQDKNYWDVTNDYVSPLSPAGTNIYTAQFLSCASVRLRCHVKIEWTDFGGGLGGSSGGIAGQRASGYECSVLELRVDYGKKIGVKKNSQTNKDEIFEL